jgi:hypothetical protein
VTRRSWLWVTAALVVAVAGVVVASSRWNGATPSAHVQASPSSPPQWVVDAAREMEDQYGEATSGYWGLLRDPELGDLTASGPDDPHHQAYAIVLVGEFPAASGRITRPAVVGSSSAPMPMPHFVLQIYTATATPVEAGVWGCGPSFDASRYPSLKPFSLE